MIYRYYRDGQKLDVAGLNEITVLIDRSETELSEVGWNCWTPKQDGPPHKHNDKDQIFYVTNGEGIIKLGNEEFTAEKGCLAYVPAGLVHQTITTTEEKLCYMLFNVFKSKEKEGHKSFAEHIEMVKSIRKEQAETGKSEVDRETLLEDIKAHKYFSSLIDETRINYSKNELILLTKNETNNCEIKCLYLIKSSSYEIETKYNEEKSLFILKGAGELYINNEIKNLAFGNVILIQPKERCNIKIISEEILILVVKGLISN
ncbi:MAG: cupin domain-containing protein [Ignavibacteriae bacterium]|nr:cupin domain-containing protein [Ignavibacteriota bacterium]MCB9210433.1 cupin domain-containing protein [Ignavibacteriales bacterium]MCB9219686.1 cupin domain-containing protein [Ignavibacteriales bacterium]MCB9259820.1 cupin domain-containing protein [Ignavibacteriales bacterium]